MKKFRTKMRKTLKGGVCLALAVCMMIAFIPATGATEAETTTAPTYEYVFSKDNLSPATTGSLYRMADAVNAEFVDKEKGYSWKPLGNGTAAQSSAFYANGYNYSVSTGSKIGGNGTLFRITVAEDGVYVPTVNYFMYKWGSLVKVYLSSTEIADSETSGKYVEATVKGNDKEVLFTGEFSTYETGITTQYQVTGNKKFENERIVLEKDKNYYLVFSIDGENTSNDSGTNYNYYQLYSFTLTKVGDLEVQPEEVTEDISFVATSNVGEGDMMTVKGFTYDEFTDSIPAGTYVTVTPKEYPGYEFKHWVRGSADNGVYVSDEPAYSFTALTHTFLTAIYENVSNEDDDAATVEFYNGNGQYLSKATSTVGGTVALPTEEPEMTGFEFANQWKTEEGVFDASAPLAKKLTRAVAQFNTPSTTFTITCGEEEVLLTYGSKHTFTSDSDVYWLRDETVVGYGKEYTHAAWDATEITTSETGELVPVVVLDDTKKDGAYMIEYNAAGKEILEVGIVFGSDGVNIGSCSSKATSQYKNQHGQFTAKPYGTESSARGYMIYKEDNTYKVVYSK